MQNNIFKNKWTMITIALLCCVLWGSAFPAVKMLYATTGVQSIFQKMMLAGMRFSLAGALVLIFSKLVQKKRIKIERTKLKYVLIIALFQTFLGYAFYYIGLANTTGVRASIIVSTSIFNVAIISLFMFKDFKLNTRKIIGMILGLSGVVLINLNAFTQGDGLRLNGEGLIYLSTVSIAFASVFTKKFSDKIDVVLLNGWQLFLGGLMLIAVAFIGGSQPIVLGTQSILLLVYTAILSAAAFSLWFVLLKHNDVASVTLFKFTIPIFGTTLSVLLLPDERFAFIMIPALLLISVGIILFTKAKKEQEL